MSQPRIAFFGLGTMGSGMARQLLRKGFPLRVYNRNPERSKAFAVEGARWTQSPAEAAEGADVVISMVADDAASRSVWLGANGALAGAPHGTLCIDCSTLSVGWVQEISGIAAEHGCEFLDAPVTGSKAQAANGELNFLVGGSEAAFQRAQPILAAMGKSATRMGAAGSGALLKLINNFICGVQIAALAEGLAMIESSGLDPAKSMEVIANGAPGSPLVKAVWARMTAPDYTPNFLLKLMAKDLRYAMDEGGKRSIELKTAAAALERFERGIAAGHGEKDIAAVVEPLRAVIAEKLKSNLPL
ncbi:MAG TPA: NAD(P)-dependent oxidoreductase [Verrucomicrobiae bacterium]|nr:NAD(P)-dependent oxidoreductase [Verrucomicrobiae bacterium]